MNIGCDANTENIIIDQKPVENVKQFQYLGSIITNDGDVEIDTRKRIWQATTVFTKMDKIWKSSKISLKIKLQLYNSIVLSTAIYACETWKTPVKLNKNLMPFTKDVREKF